MGEYDIEFAERLAAGENPDQLYRLGLKYSTGQDCDVDLVAAHMWFNIAAVRGSQAARAARADLSAELSAQEVAKAQRMAREWLSTH